VDSAATEGKVLDFLVRRGLAQREEIIPETTLLGDLGIDGHDAADLLRDFAKEFDVDLSCLKLSRHFGGEEIGLLQGLHYFESLAYKVFQILFTGKTPEQRAGLLPITVKDLFTAARTGQWPNLSALDESLQH
jgi:acyl carrier protein